MALKTPGAPQKKFTILIRVAPGDLPEREVSNEEYFASSLATSCWLRVLAARPHCLAIATARPGSLQSLASAAAVYQNCALAVEDTIVLLTVLLTLAARPDALAADVASLVSLTSRRLTPRPNYHGDLIKEVARKLGKTGRVDVNGEQLVRSLADVNKLDLPLVLGIPWQRNHFPSWVEPNEKQDWRRLPNFCSDTIADFLTQPHVGSILKAHNKLKHGPQAVVMRLEDALRRRGFTTLDPTVPRGPRLRLLFQGARTQEGTDEVCSPFLSHEARSVQAMFYSSILNLALFAAELTRWFIRANLDSLHRSVPDDSVKEILIESHRLGFGSLDTVAHDRARWLP